MSDEPMVTVRLIGLPVKAATAAAAHHDALMRELDLIRRSDHQQSLPDALRALLDELSDRFDVFAPQPRSNIDRAVVERSTDNDESVETVDLEFNVTQQRALAAKRLSALFEQVDEFCRAGEYLVTVESPPEARALRSWVLGQFVEQGEGRKASAWLEWKAEHVPIDVPKAVQWTSAVDGQTADVKLRGELDIDISPQMRDYFNELNSQGVSMVTIDCEDVTFIDSVGLSVLIAIHRRCEEAGGRVQITNPSPVVARTLEIAGVGPLFGVG